MISIIVTIYNVDKYLLTCLESIQKQSFEDFEAILVDDGSTDSSGLICDDFQKKDSRFKPIHQINCGVSGARNMGLNHAKGDYITFVDGDDYIHPLFLETLLKGIIETGSEVSMINGETIYDFIEPKTIIINQPQEVNQEFLIKNMFLNSKTDFQILALWNKLYSREIIQGLEFKDIVSEDGEFNIRVYLRLSKMAYTDAPLYYYMQHNNSLTHKYHTSKRFIDEIQPYYLYLQYIPKDNIKYRAYCLEKLFKRVLNIRFNAKNTIFQEYAELEISKVKKTYITEFKNNSYISPKMKTVILSFLFFPFLYTSFRWFNEMSHRTFAK